MTQCLCGEYKDKNEFIKDFIGLCRSLKHIQPVSIAEHTKVCGEHWFFYIQTDNDKVSTKAWNYYKDEFVPFPMTTWGAPYSRWDTELREFLQREVCKER